MLISKGKILFDVIIIVHLNFSKTKSAYIVVNYQKTTSYKILDFIKYFLICRGAVSFRYTFCLNRFMLCQHNTIALCYFG